MHIPLPWPVPERGIAYPHEAHYFCVSEEPAAAPLWVIELFGADGFFMEGWEQRLWELRTGYPEVLVILQVTALPPALIFPDSWGLRGFLVYGPVWEALHGLPLPPSASEGLYRPGGGWHLIGPTYHPPHTAMERLNTFLRALQAWRRSLPVYQPHKSSLFHTTADRVYPHFCLDEVQVYVASLRR